VEVIATGLPGTESRYDGPDTISGTISGTAMTAPPMESMTLHPIPSPTLQSQKSPRARNILGAILASLTALMVTACGANVNSQLAFEKDFSGSRTFVLTMSDSDVESLVGGIRAASRSLAIKTPDVLTFHGIEEGEEGYLATFTLPFQDLEDYQEKIIRLLEDSDVPDTDHNLTLQLDEHPLLTTLTIDESYYNDELMGWAADALIRDGIVSPDTTVFTSNGHATVTFDDKEIVTSTALPRMHFSVTKDHRFTDVKLDVDFDKSGEILVTMHYPISVESAEIQNAFITDQITQLNNLETPPESVADSGSVDPERNSDNTRHVEATFTSPAGVSAGMKILLANQDAAFAEKTAPNADSPDIVTEFVGSNWSCPTICDPTSVKQLAGDISYPEHWELVEERHRDGNFLAKINRGMPLRELTATTSLALDNSIEQRFEFVVDNSTQQGHEDTVAKRFAPPPNTASFHIAVQGTKTVYTTTFRADNADQLTSMMTTYLEEKGIDAPVRVEYEPQHGIWASYDLNIDLSPIWQVATGGVQESTNFRVELPPMHAGSTSNGISSDRVIVIDDSSGAFSLHANGPTITTIWVIVVTLLFLVVIVVLLVRTRRATTRVWGIDTVRPGAIAPYNVQGPKDQLTESQIFATPPASSHSAQSIVITGHEITKPITKAHPFPEIPAPSENQGKSHEELQDWDQDGTAPEKPETLPESTPETTESENISHDTPRDP